MQARERQRYQLTWRQLSWLSLGNTSAFWFLFNIGCVNIAPTAWHGKNYLSSAFWRAVRWAQLCVVLHRFGRSMFKVLTDRHEFSL